jgi:hypothetical protein
VAFINSAARRKESGGSLFPPKFSATTTVYCHKDSKWPFLIAASVTPSAVASVAVAKNGFILAAPACCC